MAITRFRNSTISNRTPKYNDVLAGLPFRPIIGTASDGGNGTSASVAFTGNNVANGTITYTALSSPGSFTGTGTASPITVSGLTSGTAYTFQVKAGNSLGDSAYSAASNSVTPVTPTAFESIATATGTGSNTTITFSSIPSTYQHLQLRIFCIGTDTSGNGSGGLTLRFNSDSGTNYANHHLKGNGTAVSASGGANNTSLSQVAQQAYSTGGLIGAASIIDIHDYASTTKYKTVRSFAGSNGNLSTTDFEMFLASGLWQSTSAINTITITGANTAYKAGSTFALYGIR